MFPRVGLRAGRRPSINRKALAAPTQPTELDRDQGRMAMMRRLGGAIFACVVLVTPALGQQGGSPDALQAARELQAVMSGDLVKQMVDQMMTAMWPGVENQFRAKVNAATLADIRSEFQRVMLKYVLTVQDEAPAVYAKYFSAEELRSLSAFYRTPVGVKALTVMPKVMGESMQIMVARMPDMEKELTASIEAVMHKNGYQPPR